MTVGRTWGVVLTGLQGDLVEVEARDGVAEGQEQVDLALLGGHGGRGLHVAQRRGSGSWTR